MEKLLNKTHCMDNCEGMMLLPNESIDLVVTSPPYDDLRDYGGHSFDFYGTAWNLARVLKRGGIIVWVVADATKDGSETGTSMMQALHFKELGLRLHDTMIYASNKLPLNHDRYQHSWEYMFILSKSMPKTFNPIKEKSITAGNNQFSRTFYKPNGEKKAFNSPGKVKEEKIASNIWHYTTCNSKVNHPAVYPLVLAKDHIASWSNKGDIVLDPFMGSGTTAEAAIALDRQYIGFEINPEYIPICEMRSAQTSLQITAD